MKVAMATNLKFSNFNENVKGCLNLKNSITTSDLHNHLVILVKSYIDIFVSELELRELSI